MINFLNDPSEPYTAAQFQTAILDEANPDSTASYFREASYGRAWLTGTVLGWFSMNWDDTNCNIWQTAQLEQLAAALDPSVDFSQYDAWIIVIPQSSNCGFSGISSCWPMCWRPERRRC